MGYLLYGADFYGLHGGRGGHQRRVSGEPHWRSKPCRSLAVFSLRVKFGVVPGVALGVGLRLLVHLI